MLHCEKGNQVFWGKDEHDVVMEMSKRRKVHVLWEHRCYSSLTLTFPLVPFRECAWAWLMLSWGCKWYELWMGGPAVFHWWAFCSCCPHVLRKQSHSPALLLALCHCVCLFIPLQSSSTLDWVFRALEVQNGSSPRLSSFSRRVSIFLLGLIGMSEIPTDLWVKFNFGTV